jgi:hypothetical protein
VSKYNITVRSSKYQLYVIRAFLLLCLSSIWFWPLLVPWQWLVQLVFSVLVIYVGYDVKFIDKTTQQFELDDQGIVQLLIDKQYQQFTLLSASVTSDWFCFVVLSPKELLSANKKQRFWVFRDAVDEQSYRRICRVIQRVRRS